MHSLKSQNHNTQRPPRVSRRHGHPSSPWQQLCGVCASSLGLPVRARSHHAGTLVCVCVCAHAVSRGIGDWQLRHAALHPLHSPPAQQLSTSTVPAASLYQPISRGQEEEKHSPWRGPRRFKPPEHPHRAGGRVAGHHDENTCVWKGGGEVPPNEACVHHTLPSSSKGHSTHTLLEFKKTRFPLRRPRRTTRAARQSCAASS